MRVMRMVSEARWAALAATLAVLSVALAACPGGGAPAVRNAAVTRYTGHGDHRCAGIF